LSRINTEGIKYSMATGPEREGKMKGFRDELMEMSAWLDAMKKVIDGSLALVDAGVMTDTQISQLPWMNLFYEIQRIKREWEVEEGD